MEEILAEDKKRHKRLFIILFLIIVIAMLGGARYFIWKGGGITDKASSESATEEGGTGDDEGEEDKSEEGGGDSEEEDSSEGSEQDDEQIKCDGDAIYDLTDDDNATSITVKCKDKIVIDLRSRGDGGYEFDDPEFDSSSLKLDSHVHTSPLPGSPLGDFGRDKWTFTTIKTDKTQIIIKIFRPWEPDVKEEAFRVDVIVS